MTRNHKIWRILPLVAIGTWFFHSLYKTATEVIFLDAWILLVIAIIGFPVLAWEIYLDTREFKATKKMISFLPTIVGVIFILANYGLFVHQDRRMNSATLISGFYDGGYNGFSVDFKIDGSYVMANGSGLGESYFYGKYTIEDSVITIDNSEIDNCIKSNKLVIRTDNYFPKDSLDLIRSTANYITQVAHDGSEIDREFRFRVTEDNRQR